MKADEKFLFFIIALVFFIAATMAGVKAETIFLILGIILTLYFSYGDLTKA
jgi:hypothetical protein